MRYIALDLDKKNAFAGTFDSETRQTHQERLPLLNDANSLNQFLSSLRPDDILSMEAQPGSFYLHDLCQPRVAEVHIIEPHWFGAILSRLESKTDRNDTGVMLSLMRAGVLRTVWVPSPDIRTQRIVAAHRKDLEAERTRWINRIHALLVEHGLAQEAAELLRADWPLVQARLKGRMSPAALSVLASNVRLLRQAEEEMRLANAELEAMHQPGREIAVTLPGLDSVLASAALAAIGEVERFKRPDSVSNYAGLVPSLKSTGGKTRHGRTKRRGSAVLRWAMVSAANSARRVPGPFRERYNRLRRRGRSHHKAILAVARHMLEILWHMLTKNEAYRHIPTESAKRKQRRRGRRSLQAQQVLNSTPDAMVTLRLNISSLREAFQVMAPR